MSDEDKVLVTYFEVVQRFHTREAADLMSNAVFNATGYGSDVREVAK